jgi:hypothetical protein
MQRMQGSFRAYHDNEGKNGKPDYLPLLFIAGCYAALFRNQHHAGKGGRRLLLRIPFLWLLRRAVPL